MSLKIKSPDTFRQNIRAKLTPIIGDEKMATNLEKGVFNYAIKEANTHKIVKKWENPHFVQLYTDRLRSVYVNMKQPAIIESVKTKEIPAQSVAFMMHQEFNPERWSQLIDKKMKRDASKYTDNTQASTDMFT